MSAPEHRDRIPLRIGLAAAVMAAAADQISKFWLLNDFGLAERGRVAVMPFIDLVLAWNTGISYGLFQQTGPLGRGALLAFKAIAVVLLVAWLLRTRSRLAGLALGLIVGGAIGNGIDSVVHGAVMDFILFHFTAGTWTFQWYIFNLADAAIVAGVIGLVIESLLKKAPQKRPDVT